jgi:hypothetical protein
VIIEAVGPRGIVEQDHALAQSFRCRKEGGKNNCSEYSRNQGSSRWVKASQLTKNSQYDPFLPEKNLTKNTIAKDGIFFPTSFS